MDYELEGTPIEISREWFMQNIGKRICYLRGADIDRSGRGYYFPRYGTVEGVFRRSAMISGDYYSIKSFEQVNVLS